MCVGGRNRVEEVPNDRLDRRTHHILGISLVESLELSCTVHVSAGSWSLVGTLIIAGRQ